MQRKASAAPESFASARIKNKEQVYAVAYADSSGRKKLFAKKILRLCCGVRAKDFGNQRHFWCKVPCLWHLDGYAGTGRPAWYFIAIMHTYVDSTFAYSVFACIAYSVFACTFAGMQHSQAYQSCCTCLHSWLPGLTQGCDYGGYRSFLHINSRGRRATFRTRTLQYEYGFAELRPPAKSRTTALARRCLAVVSERHAETLREYNERRRRGNRVARNPPEPEPFLGYKHAPLQAKWPGFDWYRYNIPDFMHGEFRLFYHNKKISILTLLLTNHTDTKILCEMILKVLVGAGKHGFYSAWSKRGCDNRHRIEAEAKGIFRTTWIHANARDDSPLPWRLTRDQITLLDRRMRNVMWPHHIERLYFADSSFWVRPNRIWKAMRKIRLLYYILPTQLRDQVPAVRHALYTFVWAMRRLSGQVYSFDEATSLGILPGSRGITASEIAEIHSHLIRGLVLLEGSLPVSHLNPGMHHFVHYAQYTLTHGLLTLYWMMSFERFVRKTCALTYT